jgi:hypothetical protein
MHGPHRGLIQADRDTQARKAAWVDAFVIRLSALHARAEPAMFVALAHELFETQGENDPAAIAQAEWDSWPPQDT